MILTEVQQQESETPMRIGGNVRGSVDGGASVRVANSDIPSSPFVPSTSPGGNTSVRMQDIDLSSPLNYGTPSSMGSIRTPRSGVRGTPIRSRPDIRTDRRIRQVNLGSDAVSVHRKHKNSQIFLVIKAKLWTTMRCNLISISYREA